MKAQWKNESLKQALSSYSGFCELIRLDKAQNYLARSRVHEADWGSVELDAEGLALQSELEERQTVSNALFPQMLFATGLTRLRSYPCVLPSHS